MPNTDTLNAIARTPIPGDVATGESIRYDERFATLESEIGKLENPAGGEVDWRLVEDGAVELLTTKSKDILLAAWLARAMYQRGGFPELAAGLGMIRGLLDAFWDQLHPQRVRPRRAALEWLGEKLAASIDDAQLASDPTAIAQCITEIKAIVSWSEGRFDGEDCGLLSLSSRLRAAPQPAAADPAVDSANHQSGGSQGGSRATGAVASSGPIGNRTQAVARLRELAEWWSKHEPSSPMVPLLNRAVHWADSDFQTLFSQLLRSKVEAKDYMWDVLGLTDQQNG